LPPALVLMLAMVSVWVALFAAVQLAAVRRHVLLAAALYVSNWSTSAQHGSYFARFAAPLPLGHLWSLAIEEQFYLVSLWLLLAGIWAAVGVARADALRRGAVGVVDGPPVPPRL
jgi:peptidoglycan/LPS O-acetylase OafA/YrhL